MGDALNLMKEYKIGGIPVVDGQHKLVGIVTNRDLRFEQNGPADQGSNDPAKIWSPPAGNRLEMAADILQNYKIEKLPVVDENNRLIGLITYKDITKAKDRPNACKDTMGRLRVAAAVGVTKRYLRPDRSLDQIGRGCYRY